jgi:hypothetical protein
MFAKPSVPFLPGTPQKKKIQKHTNLDFIIAVYSKYQLKFFQSAKKPIEIRFDLVYPSDLDFFFEAFVSCTCTKPSVPYTYCSHLIQYIEGGEKNVKKYLQLTVFLLGFPKKLTIFHFHFKMRFRNRIHTVPNY